MVSKPTLNGSSASAVSSAAPEQKTQYGKPDLSGFNGKFDNFNKTAVDIYDKLEYGPAPESAAGVESWLDAHDRKFGHFVNNQWYHPEGRKYRSSECPSTKETLCETIEANADDIDFAMKAASEAQKKWAALSCHERAKHLYSIARHVQKHARILSVLESLDNGKSFRETKSSDIPLVARHFYHHAGWAQLMEEEMPDYKPVGVVAAIVPWNFPLMLLSWKVCPALAMGNTVVVKSASVTRLSALLFAEICAEAGLPPGVFNVITGTGRVGSMMADHPLTDKVAFTGSTDIGRLLRRRVAGTGKKISLELGGKSPIIVFESADLDSAVEGVVDAIWFNQGQVCCAGSRLLVQESVAERFISKLKRRMDTFRLSHSLEKDIDMGPLVDESQYKSVKGFVERAKAEGAEVYHAQVDIPSCGYFYPPTLITNVSPSSECVREEVFGPVLASMTFRDPNEAIKLANNTKFGLGGSVWSEDISLAMEVAVSIKAGAIWINAHNLFDAAAGFGGYRESGFGRDGGREGLYEYVVPKWWSRPTPSLEFPCSGPKWNATTPAIPADPKASALGNFSGPFGSGTTVDRTPKIYYGGAQKRPDWEYSRTVLGPKGDVISQVAEGNRKDIRNAVEAAHKAAPGWGKRAAHNRAQICYYIAENLAIRANEFALRIVAQTGRSLESAQEEVELSIQRLFHYAAYADKYGGEVKETTLYGLTVAIHEPVGVIGIVCPDEYPLLGFISLFAPAVVRGNTCIIIPSEKYPLCATDLYQVFETSDLPGGVVNIITGDKNFLSKTIVDHCDVEAIWYFGDEQTCMNIEYSASENMKRSWVNYGVPLDWTDKKQGQGGYILHHAVEVKNIWAPMGEAQ